MQHSNVIHIFSLLYCNFKKSILSEMYTSVCFISALLSNLELSCDILFKSLGDVWQKFFYNVLICSMTNVHVPLLSITDEIYMYKWSGIILY